MARLYGVKSIPATYLLDQNGKVYRTGLRGKALDKAIEKLLAKGGAGQEELSPGRTVSFRARGLLRSRPSFRPGWAKGTPL